MPSLYVNTHAVLVLFFCNVSRCALQLHVIGLLAVTFLTSPQYDGPALETRLCTQPHELVMLIIWQSSVKTG